MRASRGIVALICVGMMLSVAVAQGDTATSPRSMRTSPGFGWQGWGPRAGLTSSPDQAVGGVHFDLGDIGGQVWFQPDVVIGFGDDTTSLVGTAPFWYRFRQFDKVAPYVGGAVGIGWFRVDRNNRVNRDFEVGVQIGGGAQWQLKSSKILAELRLDLGDLWDAQALVGWTF